MKAKPCRDSPGRHQAEHSMEVSGALSASAALQPPPYDSIASFPTLGQPISNTMLKEMLVSLRASLHADIVSGGHSAK